MSCAHPCPAHGAAKSPTPMFQRQKNFNSHATTAPAVHGARRVRARKNWGRDARIAFAEKVAHASLPAAGWSTPARRTVRDQTPRAANAPFELLPVLSFLWPLEFGVWNFSR